MMKKYLFTGMLIGMLALPPIAFSTEEENDENVYYMKEELVTAESAADIPEDVQDTVTAEEIRQPSVSGSVLDSLQNQAGVQFQRGSLNGSDSGKLRLRGFNETRLKVLRNGISIHRDGSYGNGPVDWSSLSSEEVERIDIIRGAGPAKYGNTIGGVVNIVTRKPEEKPETTASLTYGSFDTWNAAASHAMKIGPAGWRLSASHFETDGYLRNNFMERDNFSGDIIFEMPGRFEFGAGLTVSDMENGKIVYNRPDSPYYDSSYPDADGKELGGPGIGSRLLNGSYAWGAPSSVEDKNIAFNAYGLKKFDAGHIRADFRIWNQDRHEVYYDADDNNKKIYERDTEAEDDNWSLQAEAAYTLGNHNIEAGGELKHYGWGEQNVKYIDTSYFNKSINFFKFVSEGFEGQPDIMSYSALYLQDVWKILPALDVEIGVRQEWFRADGVDPEAFGFTWETEETEMDESNTDPRAAVTFRPWEGGSLTARFGISHRYPTSPEYFWWYLNKGTDYFNTDFNSEEAVQYELAYKQTLFDRLDFFVRGYYYDIDDYITSTFVSGIGSVYYNIGSVTIKGAEFGISSLLPFHLKAWANMTWQNGDKEDDPWDTDNELTNQVPNLPDIMLNAGLDYRPNEKFTARAWVNYVGERDYISSNTLTELDAYTLLNITASWQFLETGTCKWELIASGENLLDEDYEEEAGYPMAGASAIGGIRVQF